MIRTLIFGAGRMAHSLLSVVHEYPEVSITGVVSNDPSDLANEKPVSFYDSLQAAYESRSGEIDLVIDFSLAVGTPVAAGWCAEQGVALLSGVTGIDAETHAALDAAACKVPVLWAPNLSFGVNLLAGLIREIAPLAGGQARVSIEETHHAGKKDAPSGTALFLAEQFGSANEIECHSIREGDVVGEHSVTINFPDETLVLTHTAQDRRLFARGALEAGQWLTGQSAGRYSAADWISGEIRARNLNPNGQA